MNNNKNRIYYRIFLVVFSIICFFANSLQCFNNNLWCDEIASVVIAKKSCIELINSTAMDVHPPLYYLILKLFCTIFGYSGVVFHFVSMIPYALILIVSLTLIWNELGKIASTFLVVFSSLLFSSIHFNVEIRMYSWGSLFILLSYFYFYEAMKKEKGKYYFAFSISSLLAAYTHYFCIITVIPFYLVLLFLGIKERGNRLKEALFSWTFTIIAYLPWALSFLFHYVDTKDKIYSANYNSILICLEYIFYSKFSWVLLAIFLILVVVSFLLNLGNYEKMWIATGVIGIALTIIVPYAISALMSPIMEKRHVYPSFIIAWLLLGYCVSRCKYKTLIFGLIFLMIVPTGFLALYNANVEEQRSEVLLEDFIGNTSIEVENSEMIISNEWQMAYSLLEYYYSRMDRKVLIDTEEEIIEYIKNASEASVLLFLKNEISLEFINQMESNGFRIETVYENGYIGSLRIWAYECHK